MKNSYLSVRERSSRAGFTVIEVFSAIGIFSIIALAVFGVMSVGRNASFIGDTSAGLRLEIIKAFLTIDKEVRETRPSQMSLAVGSSSTNLTFKVPRDVNNDSTILDINGNIEWSGDIVYALNGANQITRSESGVTAILANNITSLQFTRPTAPLNLLQVDITAQKTSLSRRQLQDTGQIKVMLRN